MAKNILVTGGAGYIGSHTVLQLLTGGYRMVVVGNLDNSSDVALEEVEELAGKFGDNLSFHQLVVSSFATFNGWPNEVPYAEEFPLSSTNPYGRTKLFIEEVCHDIYRSDSEWKIILLRYFHPVGAHPSGHIDVDPHGIPNNVMPFVQQVAVGGQPALTVFGNDYSTKDGTGHCFEPLLCQMASKPPTSEAIALTEKKIDMALDDIIKMSQRTSNKSKKQRRVPNENQKSLNNGPKERALKVQRYMDSRSSVRQGFLASRRSNVQGNQFPLSAENAKKAAIAPVRVGAYNGSGVANFNKKR